MTRGPIGQANARGAQTKVSAKSKTYPPLPGADRYDELVRTWYVTWATSAQASQFTATEWQRLHMLAPLVALYYANPDKNLMAEIRLNESKLGATIEDRARLRMKIEEPPDGGEKPAASRSRERKDPRQA